MPATYDDANLAMQLMAWGSANGLMDAITTVTSEDFDPSVATLADHAARVVATFGEMVGTFVKQGVLDEALVLDLWWIKGMWDRVAPAALGAREQLSEPRLFENFEALAARA